MDVPIKFHPSYANVCPFLLYCTVKQVSIQTFLNFPISFSHLFSSSYGSIIKYELYCKVCCLFVSFLNSEFCKRIDPDLPFYYNTSSDRYTEEQLPSFDAAQESVEEDGDHCYAHQSGRLHKSNKRRREDSSIITSGKCFLPPKHSKSLRNRLYKPVAEIPALPAGVDIVTEIPAEPLATSLDFSHQHFFNIMAMTLESSCTQYIIMHFSAVKCLQITNVLHL